MGRPLARTWLWIAASIAALVVVALAWSLGRTPVAPAPEQPATAEPARRPSPGPPPSAAPPADEEAVPPGELVLREHPVDLEKLRRELPNNLYWEEGAPTEDEAVLQRRAEQVRTRRARAARITANEAPPEEIDQHYDERERLSRDYLTFATRVLEEYGPQLSEQEQGLYTLTVQLHRARLDELPRQRAEAHARWTEAEKRRAAWREAQR